MKIKYTKEEMMELSNVEILEKTYGRAVDFYLYQRQPTQLCVNDLQGFKSENGCFYTRTGIKISLHDVEYIDIKLRVYS